MMYSEQRFELIMVVICGNKMPTRCNRGFLLQILLPAQHVLGTTMPIIRSSRVLYSGCCLWYLVLWFSSCWSGVELRVVCPVCSMLQSKDQQLENHNMKYHRQQPLYNTLELLMMGIVVPETCWASSKIRNKKTSVASSWHFISTYWRRCTVKIASNSW